MFEHRTIAGPNERYHIYVIDYGPDEFSCILEHPTGEELGFSFFKECRPGVAILALGRYPKHDIDLFKIWRDAAEVEVEKHKWYRIENFTDKETGDLLILVDDRVRWEEKVRQVGYNVKQLLVWDRRRRTV